MKCEKSWNFHKQGSVYSQAVFNLNFLNGRIAGMNWRKKADRNLMALMNFSSRLRLDQVEKASANYLTRLDPAGPSWPAEMGHFSRVRMVRNGFLAHDGLINIPGD